MLCNATSAVPSIVPQPRDAVDGPPVSMSTVSVTMLARFAAVVKPGCRA